MTKIERKTQKIFGVNAPSDDIAVMGSFKSGTPVYTDDIEKLQNKAFEEGYASSLVANEAPFMEEQNGIPYVLSKQLAYIFQEGIPEYDENTTYYINSICKVKGKIYLSKSDKNRGHNPSTDEDYWAEVKLGGSSGLELGTVVCMPFGVDESENKYRYLNGQVIIQTQYPAFTTKVKSWQATRANLFTTEENWQAEKTASVLGQCGKFVIDDTAGTIRLPLVININGLTDLSEVGVIKNESLPNITGSLVGGSGNDIGFSPSAVHGAFYTTSETKNKSFSADSKTQYGLGFDASKSSSTYKNNAPVQQEAIQYPYVICVNTGVEEAERPINDYTVNNPYAYGMSQYCQGVMNNNSWLKSNGQFHNGTVYTGLYAWCVSQLTAGVDGFKASSDTYDDYDFVINTADETFRLPIKAINSNYKYSYFPDFNNKTNLTTNFIAPNNGWFLLKAGTQGAITSINGLEVQNSMSTGANYSDRNIFIRVKKGDTATNIGMGGYFVPEIVVKEIDSNGTAERSNLYYYCGETLQNADLINIARIEEKLTDINATTRGYLVESYVNGLSGYRLYSDGYCEQWGSIPQTTTEYHTVTFVKPFINANYNIQVTAGSNTVTANGTNYQCNKTMTSCDISVVNYPDFSADWRASGYIR